VSDLDLANLLVDPARAADVPIADALALYTSVTRQIAQLDSVKSVLAVRLAMNRPTPQVTRDPPYTLQQAAALLGKSAPWLRRKAKTGAIPCAKKVGKSWVFPRTEFDRFRDRRQVC
jgi:excisionase family DNA binding protein